MRFFSLLAALARSLGHFAILPFDIVGRAVYSVGRTLMPAAESLCRSAYEGASWALAASRDVAVTAVAAPFALLAGRGDHEPAPMAAYAQQGWQPTVEASSPWACAAWAWARSAGRGADPDPRSLQDVPGPVARWLMTLTQRECALVGAGLPDTLERHVNAREPKARITGLRPYDPAIADDLVALAKRRAAAMAPVGIRPHRRFEDLPEAQLEELVAHFTPQDDDERPAPAPLMH